MQFNALREGVRLHLYVRWVASETMVSEVHTVYDVSGCSASHLQLLRSFGTETSVLDTYQYW